MSLVTVIIPTYKRSWGLRRAMESVLNQSLKDFELLIVDDASQYDTKSVVDSFSDPRIRYFCQPSNVGVAKNWGKGLQLANSELITFLMDDDDYEISTMHHASSQYISLLRRELSNRRILKARFYAKKRFKNYFLAFHSIRQGIFCDFENACAWKKLFQFILFAKLT